MESRTFCAILCRKLRKFARSERDRGFQIKARPTRRAFYIFLGKTLWVSSPPLDLGPKPGSTLRESRGSGNGIMRILAIDTALANCAAAVLDDGLATACFETCGEEIGRGHAEKLMDMIGTVMAESSTAFSDLDRVAVTIGPGSFTGLRVGLSVARGFGLVLSKPIVGITTLAAIAQSCAPRDSGPPVLVALTGKGEEVYCQQFSASGDPVGEPGVQTLSELARTLAQDIRFAGSAAESVAQATGADNSRIISRCTYPGIRAVAELGLTTDPQLTSPSPLYLRPPDATPQKKGRIERQ